MIEGALASIEGKLAPRGAVQAYRKAKVFVSKRVSHFDIPSQPCFDAEGMALFCDELAAAHNYLEYGSGGSTVLAHPQVSTLVSVDSDKRFLEDVRAALRGDGSVAVTRLMHANIGWTENWGMPLFVRPTPQRVSRWSRYPRAPWRYFRAMGQEPDLILIDGRFRVACALESLLHLSPDSRCRILVDDYRDRPYYEVIEQVADVRLFGRMALVLPRRSLDRLRVRHLVKFYCADPR